MTVIINGESRQVPDGLSVQGLLQYLGLSGTPVAVEVNQQVVPRRLHAQQALGEGDRLELVTLVGGG